MITLYESPETLMIPYARGGDETASLCRFDGEDRLIPVFFHQNPGALGLMHLLMEGYENSPPGERKTYWREATEGVVEWMIKKGIVELVS
jgi:hypothetical protein